MTNSLYNWIRKYGPQSSDYQKASQELDEIRRLKKELKRVTDERDLFKKSRGVLRKPPRVRYAFIKEHVGDFTIRWLCRLFDLHPSGYYAWMRKPKSARQCKDTKLSGLIKQVWFESGCVYGDRKIHRDLQDYGEVHVITPNTLAREFKPSQPNQSWVTDITYIGTHEGWLYLGVVMNFYSRKIIGWSMGSRMVTELVLDALRMAVWRRKAASRVIVHSDQGSQYQAMNGKSF